MNNSVGFECPTCKKLLCSKRSLKQHQLTHTGEKPFVCDRCGHKTRTVSQMRVHKQTHTHGLFECEQCGESYKYKGSLTSHIKRVHPKNTKNSLAIEPTQLTQPQSESLNFFNAFLAGINFNSSHPNSGNSITISGDFNFGTIETNTGNKNINTKKNISNCNNNNNNTNSNNKNSNNGCFGKFEKECKKIRYNDRRERFLMQGFSFGKDFLIEKDNAIFSSLKEEVLNNAYFTLNIKQWHELIASVRNLLNVAETHKEEEDTEGNENEKENVENKNKNENNNEMDNESETESNINIITNINSNKKLKMLNEESLNNSDNDNININNINNNIKNNGYSNHDEMECKIKSLDYDSCTESESDENNELLIRYCELLEFEELVGLKLYTDYGSITAEFRKCYYEHDIEAREKRQKQFYNWHQLISSAYGKVATTLDYDTKLFVGLSGTKFDTNQSKCGKYHGPLSVTTDKEVATGFALSDGIILTVGLGMESKGLRLTPISRFNEKEVMLFNEEIILTKKDSFLDLLDEADEETDADTEAETDEDNLDEDGSNVSNNSNEMDCEENQTENDNEKKIKNRMNENEFDEETKAFLEI